MRSAEGDDAIRAEMVRIIPELRLFATRFVRNRTDVDDLVQETLLRGLANIDKFEPGTRLKSWLFTILRNTFCTGYHRSRREVSRLDEAVSLGTSVPPAQEWGVRMREFSNAVARLPPHHRQVFQMVLVDGETYETAARRCRCRIGTIKSRVNRVRTALVQTMGGVK